MTNKNINGLTAATLPLAGTELVPIWDGATKKVSTDDLSVRNYRANATTGVMQITGPAAAAICIATVPNANWTAARTDTGQTLTGLNTFTYSGTGYTCSVINSQSAATGNGLYVQTYWNVPGNYVAKFVTNGGVTTVLTVGGDGNTTFENGNLVQGTAAKGINFTANTPAAGMTSQLLNWYEEGTWTPTVAAGAGALTSYTASGTYTRIGRQVTLTLVIAITNNGTSSSYITATGVPFANSLTTPIVGYNQSSGNATTGMLNSSTFYIFKYDGTYPVATGQTVSITVTYFI